MHLGQQSQNNAFIFKIWSLKAYSRSFYGCTMHYYMGIRRALESILEPISHMSTSLHNCCIMSINSLSLSLSTFLHCKSGENTWMLPLKFFMAVWWLYRLTMQNSLMNIFEKKTAHLSPLHLKIIMMIIRTLFIFVPTATVLINYYINCQPSRLFWILACFFLWEKKEACSTNSKENETVRTSCQNSIIVVILLNRIFRFGIMTKIRCWWIVNTTDEKNWNFSKFSE